MIPFIWSSGIRSDNKSYKSRMRIVWYTRTVSSSVYRIRFCMFDSTWLLLSMDREYSTHTVFLRMMRPKRKRKASPPKKWLAEKERSCILVSVSVLVLHFQRTFNCLESFHPHLHPSITEWEKSEWRGDFRLHLLCLSEKSLTSLLLFFLWLLLNDLKEWKRECRQKTCQGFSGHFFVPLLFFFELSEMLRFLE